MAGAHGPTWGRHHPHYVGVITMDESEMPKNDSVFNFLTGLVHHQQQHNIVVPVYNVAQSGSPAYTFSLGTGIGANQPNWDGIQKYLLTQIVSLGKLCNIQIPSGVFWPDCRKPKPYPRYPIASLADIQNIIDNVL